MKQRWGGPVTAGLVVVMCASVLVTLGPGASGAGAQESTGQVTLVHGVRGLVADIVLDGKSVLQAFQPERVTDPLTLPAGPHRVEVRDSRAASGAPPLLDTTLTVVAGARQSAVVHLSATGAPALTVYVDDSSAVPLGQARVMVRHNAAAPPFQFTIDGTGGAAAVANGAEGTATVRAGTHVLALATGGAAVLPPKELSFREGTAMALYLVGSASSADLTWLAEVLPATATAPAAVRTGNSPLEPDGGTNTTTLVVVLAGAAMLMATGMGAAHRRGRDRRVAGTAAAGLAGLALGVTSLAVTARPRTLTTASASSLTTPRPEDASPAYGGKVLGASPRKATTGVVVPPATRPAGIDAVQLVPAAPPRTIAVQPGDLVATIVAEGADPTTGEMTIPDDPSLVAWYAPGARPGDGGSAVLAGHVAYNGRPGAFSTLTDVEVGAIVMITFDDGQVRTFRVTERHAYAKAELPTVDLFRRDGPPTMVLITCGGAFDRRTHSYADNVVLLASPLQA